MYCPTRATIVSADCGVQPPKFQTNQKVSLLKRGIDEWYWHGPYYIAGINEEDMPPTYFLRDEESEPVEDGAKIEEARLIPNS